MWIILNLVYIVYDLLLRRYEQKCLGPHSWGPIAADSFCFNPTLDAIAFCVIKKMAAQNVGSWYFCFNLIYKKKRNVYCIYGCYEKVTRKKWQLYAKSKSLHGYIYFMFMDCICMSVLKTIFVVKISFECHFKDLIVIVNIKFHCLLLPMYKLCFYWMYSNQTMNSLAWNHGLIWTSHFPPVHRFLSPPVKDKCTHECWKDVSVSWQCGDHLIKMHRSSFQELSVIVWWCSHWQWVFFALTFRRKAAGEWWQSA